MKAKGKKLGKKLTAGQMAMLKSLRSGDGAYGHLRGMAACGGGAITLASLIRHELAEVLDNEFVITQRGRAALRTGRIL